MSSEEITKSYYYQWANKFLLPQEDKIDTREEYQKFRSFLSIENNNRILFSAPYGNGKSTFLADAFKDDPLYAVFYLSPIQYSISTNEDVIKLIQRDILWQTLPFLSQQKNKISELKFFWNFFSKPARLKEFINTVTKDLSYNFENLNYGVGVFTSKITGSTFKYLIDTCSEYYSEHKKQTASDQEIAINIIDELKADTDITFEAVVREAVCAIDQNKKKILIVDDIDRLDPEHIFRLFNVFSSSFFDGKEEKFGFDKIIFVCDVENIRHIFHHKYGYNVDFAGYIDKFYSIVPFQYDIKNKVLRRLDTFINKFNTSYSNLQEINTLIQLLFNNKIISLRDIWKVTAVKYDNTIEKKYGHLFGTAEMNISNSFFCILDYLTNKIPGLEEKLSRVHVNIVYKPNDIYLRLLLLSAFQCVNISGRKTEAMETDEIIISNSFELEDIDLKFKMVDEYNAPVTDIEYMNGNPRSDIPIYEVLYKALHKFRERAYNI